MEPEAFMKKILVYNAPTPYPKDIKTNACSQLNQIPVPVFVNYTGEDFGVYPVAALGKYSSVVDLPVPGAQAPG